MRKHFSLTLSHSLSLSFSHIYIFYAGGFYVGGFHVGSFMLALFRWRLKVPIYELLQYASNSVDTFYINGYYDGFSGVECLPCAAVHKDNWKCEARTLLGKSRATLQLFPSIDNDILFSRFAPLTSGLTRAAR